MSGLEILQILIYLIFGFSIIAYVTLDGFDLGVGCLHLLAKGDRERRLMINTIGPVWDGNTTWLVVGGGVLFAGFPKVFSILMSGLYTPIMILLFALMLRGAAVEFRSKKHEKSWRYFWDFCFFFASLLITFCLGLMLGNLIEGLPVNGKGYFEGDFSMLFRPYPLLIAFFALSIFTMHGTIYVLMKTEGELHDRLRKWIKWHITLFLTFWAVTTYATFVYQPRMVEPFQEHPWMASLAFLSLISIFSIPHALSRRKDGLAFLFSCLTIFFLLALFAIGTYPYLAFSTIDPVYHSLTLFNSSASFTALLVLAIVAGSGFPLAFFYGAYLYKVFRGKVKLDPHSY